MMQRNSDFVTAVLYKFYNIIIVVTIISLSSGKQKVSSKETHTKESSAFHRSRIVSVPDD